MTSTRPVTVENFVRAETDTYFRMFVERGGIGNFYHHRGPPSLRSLGVRPNRDTLYSEAVFDLDAGPVTIRLPDARGRFMALQVIDEDHYARNAIYHAGAYTYGRERIGTRYVFAAVRTLVDPNDPRDVARVHALQNAITAWQPGGVGRLELPRWDPASHRRVRDALIALGATLPDLRRAFGAKGMVDPVRHLIGAAMAWGGNPDHDAIYLNVTPPANDGKVVHRLIVRGDVPVDGFWSISVYDADGRFVENERDAYTVNSITARRRADGAVAVQFGDCGDGPDAADGDGSEQALNCLPVFPGWNYMVRLYRPRTEVLSGTWAFPEARPFGEREIVGAVARETRAARDDGRPRAEAW